MDDAPVQAGAGEGDCQQAITQGRFVSNGVDANGEAGDDGDRVIGEAGNQLVAHLLPVFGIAPRANHGEELEFR